MEGEAWPGRVGNQACGRARTRMVLSCLPALDMEMLKWPCAWSSGAGTTGHISAWADPKPHDSVRVPVSLSKGYSVL